MPEDNKTPPTMPEEPAPNTGAGGSATVEIDESAKAAAAKAAADKVASEQLLKLLDVQLMASRQKRTELDSGRNSMRIFAIIFIVFGAAIALWVLMYMLEEMRPEKAPIHVDAESSR